MPPDGSAGVREELRQILKKTGILYSTVTQPIRHRNGAIAPWAFYSWNATLTAEGLRLAGLTLLERLATFRSTQLVSYGYTAMPLLSACVLLSGGKYTGAAIRERRKPYLSCRRIEGPFDKTRPVIVVDDSLSSGNSLHNAITAVEDEGGVVEGAVALVHFPFRGGMEWANGAGYRTETIFNIWTDLEMAGTPNEPAATSYDSILSADRFSDGSQPAVLARKVADAYLRHGVVPQPPRFLDGTYDARGGTFVSIRRRRDDLRLARDGFWRFSPEGADPCRDVILATIDTLRGAAGLVDLRSLDELKFGVTFFGPLESITPAKLDFDRYGIVVRSRILPNKQGGALPNTQFFISEIEQYRHARSRNAGVDTYEPHDLYRHTLVKCVEPGESWLPYGQPEGAGTNWWRDAQIGEQLTARARALVENLIETLPGGGRAATVPLANSLIPCAVDGVGVKLYNSGTLIGYGLSLGHNVDECLRDAVQQISQERRFKESQANLGSAALDISVAVLHHPERFEGSALSEVTRKLRRGLDSIAVTHYDKTTALLPSALTYNNWSSEEFVNAALARAGIAGTPSQWATYQTAEWVSNRFGTFPLRFGFPWREGSTFDKERAGACIRMLASYIFEMLGEDGLPCYAFAPVTDERQHFGTSARSLHGLLTLESASEFLAEPAWHAAAIRGYEQCLSYVRDGTLELPGRSGGALADCVLLMGVARSRTDLVFSRAAGQLAARLALMFRADGRISAVPKRLDCPDDQDYLPGAVLLAIGEYCRASGSACPVTSSHLEWYRARFDAVPNWGMAGWQPQGWGAVFKLTHDVKQAEFAFQTADWAVAQQLEKNGAFLEDLSPDEPSFDTGFIAEGIAAAWDIARVCGDDALSARYERSWREAMRFMTTLMVFPEDTFGMRAGGKAVGGVRCMLSRSDIRIDHVSHCLNALVRGARLLSSQKL